MIKSRPLSPHIQVYRWNIYSLTSIIHRFSGVVLYSSLIALSWALFYFTYFYDPTKEGCHCEFMLALKYAIVFIIWGAIFSLFYHLLNGIKHLFHDAGAGFELKVAKRNARVVIILSILLTIATALFILR